MLSRHRLEAFIRARMAALGGDIELIDRAVDIPRGCVTCYSEVFTRRATENALVAAALVEHLLLRTQRVARRSETVHVWFFAAPQHDIVLGVELMIY